MDRLNAVRNRIRNWMQRVRGPEPQPVVLVQTRVYVLPSGAGVAMIVTVIVMLLASMNYNLSLGYAMSFLLGGIGIAHILQSWRTLVNLQISLRPVGEVFAGDRAEFLLHLHNPGRHERAGVRVLSRAGEELVVAAVAPGGDTQVSIWLPAARRGLLPVGQLTVETRQPLGWIRAWSYIEPDAKTIVFPAPAGDLPIPENLAYGEEAERSLAKGSEDFAGLREYQRTDSPSQIAWKSLARGQVLSKQFAGGASPDWILDWTSMPGEWSAEAKLSQLTQWVLTARQLSARTELRLLHHKIGPGSDATHHLACLQKLALFGRNGT